MWPDHIQWQPPTDQTLYRTRPFTEFWVVSIEHLRRVWHADRGRLLLRTLGPVPLGLAYVLLVVTHPFPNMSLFYRTMLFEYPSVLSRFCLKGKNRNTTPKMSQKTDSINNRKRIFWKCYVDPSRYDTAVTWYVIQTQHSTIYFMSLLYHPLVGMRENCFIVQKLSVHRDI